MIVARWLKPLRLPICFLASLLTIAGFRLGGTQIFWLAVMAVFFGTGATMLQNDWRDRRHDVRKGKALALQHPQAFLVLLSSFWTTAAGLILVVARQNIGVGMALVAMAGASLAYSETRRIFMVPVTLVALTSGSPALLSIIAGANGHQSWLLFLSTTLIIFGREVTKDIDDERIDSGYKWTIPLALGNNRAKVIASVAIIVGFAVVTKISATVLPAMPLVIAGLVPLARNVQLRATRICIDCGMALAILTLIFLD